MLSLFLSLVCAYGPLRSFLHNSEFKHKEDVKGMKEKKRNEKKTLGVDTHDGCHVISSTCQGQIEEIERGKL